MQGSSEIERLAEDKGSQCGRNGKGERSVNAREMKETCQKKVKGMQGHKIEVEVDHMLLEDMYSVRAHTLTDERRCCT